MRILVVPFLLLSNLATAQYMVDSTLIISPRPVYDEYFGQTIEDQFRYLEDLENPEVQQWLKAQNDHSRKILSNVTNKDSILSKIDQINKHKGISISFPKATGERIFYIKTLNQDDVEQLCYRDSMAGEEILLFDTRQHLEEGNANSATIDYIDPSPSGDYVAFGVSTDGTEMAVLHTIQVDNKKLLSGRIERAMYGNPAWLPDESGFFYNQRTPSSKQEIDSSSETTHTSKVLLHVLNTPVEQDVEIFSRTLNPSLPIEPIDFPFPLLFPSSSMLFVYVYRGALDDLTVYKAPLVEALTVKEKKAIEWQPLITTDDKVTDFAVIKDDLFLLTHKNASNYKLIKTSVDNIDIKQAATIIDSSEFILDDIHLAGESLYVKSSLNSISHLDQVDIKDYSREEVPLPFEGTVYLNGKFFAYGEKLFLKITNWIHPTELYFYNAQKKETKITPLQPKDNFSITDDLVVEEVEVVSHDGVRVPLSIIRHRDAKKNGKNLTALEGYGAYGIAFNPAFQTRWLPWLEYGGILAVAHVRGGGEKGEAWHRAGMKANKPNSWKDFIACAEYLIDSGYTSKEHLGAYSGSAGGIMLGRAITEKPALFQAATVQVGVMNPLRHEFRGNNASVPEYGTVEDSLEFQYLYEMDSYHHVKDDTKYPAMLFTAGMNDARLPPWLPGKMVAQLQQVGSSKNPILFRLEYNGGHFGGSLSQQDREWADIFAFLLWQLGHPDFVLENS